MSGTTTSMSRCACGQPVKVKRPKGTALPTITACRRCTD